MNLLVITLALAASPQDAPRPVTAPTFEVRESVLTVADGAIRIPPKAAVADGAIRIPPKAAVADGAVRIPPKAAVADGAVRIPPKAVGSRWRRPHPPQGAAGLAGAGSGRKPFDPAGRPTNLDPPLALDGRFRVTLVPVGDKGADRCRI